MKICSKCKENKEFSEFGKSKQSKDGHKSACKACLTADNRLYYDKNSEKESVRKKKQYDRDKEKIIAQQLVYYNRNKEYRSEWVKNKRREQPDVFKEYGKAYREKNREDVNFYHRNRRKVDPLYKLQHLLRVRTCKVLTQKKLNKSSDFNKYLGCTIIELKNYLESKFLKGMNWGNHTSNGWHIDHIVPLDSAKTEEELYKLCHYTNLQPLWAIDNLKKSNKI